MREKLEPGTPLELSGPDNISLLLCPSRSAEGSRLVTLRASDSPDRRVLMTLDREDLGRIREFCNVWLGQPYEEPDGTVVWPDKSQDIEAVRKAWNHTIEEYNELYHSARKLIADYTGEAAAAWLKDHPE